MTVKAAAAVRIAELGMRERGLPGVLHPRERLPQLGRAGIVQEKEFARFLAPERDGFALHDGIEV